MVSVPSPALIVSMPLPPVIMSLPASPVIVSASVCAERSTSDPPEAVLIVSMFFNLSLSAKVCLPVDNCRTSASAPPSITSVSPLPAAAIVIISSPPAPSILSAPALPVSLSTPAPPVSVKTPVASFKSIVAPSASVEIIALVTSLSVWFTVEEVAVKETETVASAFASLLTIRMSASPPEAPPRS